MGVCRVVVSGGTLASMTASLVRGLLCFCSMAASHPLLLAYLLFFSLYQLAALSFLGPLLVSTCFLLLALLTVSPYLCRPTLYPPPSALPPPLPPPTDGGHVPASKLYRVPTYEVEEFPIKLVRRGFKEDKLFPLEIGLIRGGDHKLQSGPEGTAMLGRVPRP